MKKLFIGLFALAATVTAARAFPKDVPAQPHKMPLIGILSAANSAGIIQYCIDKKLITQKEVGKGNSKDLIKPDTDPELNVLAQQAKEVGKRGVMFTFGNPEQKNAVPAATLEDIAVIENTSPKNACKNLAHAGDATVDPAKGT